MVTNYKEGGGYKTGGGGEASEASEDLRFSHFVAPLPVINDQSLGIQHFSFRFPLRLFVAHHLHILLFTFFSSQSTKKSMM